jgi:site-specific DNA-methyltransferase (adenine-specific)
MTGSQQQGVPSGAYGASDPASTDTDALGDSTTATPYYQDEFVTLWHGDCRDVLPTLEPVDLVLTDPPYGVTYNSNRVTGRGAQPISNDGTRLSLRLYREVIPALRAEHVLWFTRWDAWPDVWGDLGMHFPLRGLLVWDKGHNGMGDLKHWGNSYELIASAGTAQLTGSRDGSVLRFKGVSRSARNHPTEKPVDLLRYFIDKIQPRSVLDPFAGSGTTLVAAREAGARAIGIEVDERYCEVIAQRLAQGAQSDLFGGAA